MEISNNYSLQSYIHEMGLEAFLKQLNDIFAQASLDVDTFDLKETSRQYDRARWGINSLRRSIFMEEKSRYEMEQFIFAIYRRNNLALGEDVLKKEIGEMPIEKIKSEFELLTWLFTDIP